MTNTGSPSRVQVQASSTARFTVLRRRTTQGCRGVAVVWRCVVHAEGAPGTPGPAGLSALSRLLDRGQGRRDALLSRVGPGLDLGRPLAGEALLEERLTLGAELPRLGQLGPSVDRLEGVAPPRAGWRLGDDPGELLAGIRR